MDLKCFRYNPNTGFCEECVPGFFKDEVIGACIDKQCDNIIDGECVKCTNGYYLPKDEIICRKNL